MGMLRRERQRVGAWFARLGNAGISYVTRCRTWATARRAYRAVACDDHRGPLQGEGTMMTRKDPQDSYLTLTETTNPCPGSRCPTVGLHVRKGH